VLMCVDGHAAMPLLHEMLLADSGQRGGRGLVGINGCG